MRKGKQIIISELEFFLPNPGPSGGEVRGQRFDQTKVRSDKGLTELKVTVFVRKINVVDIEP